MSVSPEIKEREDGRSGVGECPFDGGAKRAVDEKQDAEQSKQRHGLIRPMVVAEEKRGDGHDNRDAGRLGATVFGQGQKLPCSQHGYRRYGQCDQPFGAEEHQRQHQGRQNQGGDYAFHSGMRIHRRGR